MRGLIVMIGLCGLILSGCDEQDQGENPGKAEAFACLAHHPALERKVYLKISDAVGAFASAAEDCEATKKEMVSFAKELEKNGFRLSEEGDAR